MAPFDRLRGNRDKPRFEVHLTLAAEQTIDGPAALFELWRAGDSAPLASAPLGVLHRFDELIPDDLDRSAAKAARRALEGTLVRQITGAGVELYSDDNDEAEVSFLRVGETIKFYPSRPELSAIDASALAAASQPDAGPTLGL